MKAKVFLTILLACLVISLLGCTPTSTGPSMEPFKYDDLVMVDTSITQVGTSTMGAYVLFFERHQSRIANHDQVSVKFDGSLEKPIVEGALCIRGIEYSSDKGKIFGVAITFKNREQMKEYWLRSNIIK